MLRVLQTFILFLTVVGTMVLCGCADQPPAEEACNFVQNRMNRRVSWARMPIVFYADSNITAQQETEIREAMAIWNDLFKPNKVFELVGRSKQLPQPVMNNGEVIPDGYNGIYIANKDIFENSNVKDEQARTSISFRGDFIYESDILIDESESFFYANNEIKSSEGKISFKSLIVHELGHVLGLEHIEEQGYALSAKSDANVLVPSVMNPKLQNGEYRVDITDKDFDSLACEYQ